MAKRVTVRDRGWNRIKKDVERIKREPHTKVGVQAGEKAGDGGDLVVIAASNEFGTKDGHIPSRPFLRQTFEENRREIEDRKARIWQAILLGRATMRTGLGLLGAWYQGKVQQQIVKLSEPPNAPSTIARKGSSNPLVDTGRLRQSIRHVEENV